MLPIIQRDPAREMVSAQHSVVIVNQILAKETKTRAEINALKANVNQLQSVVLLPIWTNQDLSGLHKAINDGKAWIELGLDPVEPTTPPPELVHEYPWGDREPTLPELEDYLVILRNAKDKEINAHRLAANNSFFMFKGKKIACDLLSRSDIDGANGHILLTGEMPPYWPGGWKTMDNTYVPITNKEDWVAFYKAMYAQGLYNFSKAQTLKNHVISANTIAAIRAITW